MSVDLFSWNPVRPIGPRFPMNRLRRPVNNFGDLLGPMLIRKILDERGIDPSGGQGRLLSVGSIMHFGRPGDVVWGSGVNGKIRDLPDPSSLDIRAVRGPLTYRRLRAVGADVPAIFGEPGLLWSRYFPASSYNVRATGVVVVPNLNDRARYEKLAGVLSPRTPVHEMARRIAGADLVVGSSLHALVLAESYGVPARAVRSAAESDFKYADYYRGTGRSGFMPAVSVEHAIEMGGDEPPHWDATDLLNSFPEDLWLTKGCGGQQALGRTA